MRNNYKTNQKEKILSVIKELEYDWTIKDLYKRLDGVGLTTIYRYINSLVLNGTISKNIGNNNITYYHYLNECKEDNHFYLKCDSCGKLEHIDCDCIKDLTKHILKEHEFTTNKDHIILNGICKKCRRV